MATDMQSIVNRLSGQGSHSAPETRDRNDDLPRTSPSKRFDALLGSALPRRISVGLRSDPVI